MRRNLPIRLIWARDTDGVIGRAGALPWFLPDDLKHFRRETMNTVCVMGRRTIDSLQGRTLPGRPLICMSQDSAYTAPQSIGTERTMGGVLARANDLAAHFRHLSAITICGGAQIFDLWYPLAKEVVETVVHVRVPDGDTRLPVGLCPGESSGWRLAKEARKERDGNHAHTMDFLWWVRDAPIDDSAPSPRPRPCFF